MKYKVAYLDEEEMWQAIARTTLGVDFDLRLINVPIAISDIWPYIVENEIQALVVDFRLFESGQVSFDGNQVVREVMSHNLHYPMFVMTSYETDAIESSDNVMNIRGKETLEDEKQYSKFREILKAKVAEYIRKEESAKNCVDQLNEKSLKEVLTPVEEENRFKAELYLSELDRDNAAPLNTLTSAYSTQLQNLLEQANQLLEKLQ